MSEIKELSLAVTRLTIGSTTSCADSVGMIEKEFFVLC